MLTNYSEPPISLVEQRDKMLVQLADIKSIQYMDRDELLALQAGLGFGSVWGIFEIPSSSLPIGIFQKLSKRRFDLNKVSQNNCIAVCAVVKVILLRWLIPIGRSTIPCSASTLSLTIADLVRLVPIALEKLPVKSTKFWSHITEEDLYSVVPWSQKKDFGKIFETFRDRKLLEDNIPLTLRRRGERLELSRKGLPTLISENNVISPFVHLPDDFVGECGWRCIWVIKELAPPVLSALEFLYNNISVRRDVTRPVAAGFFNQASKEVLSKWNWSIEKIPFTLNITTNASKKAKGMADFMSWPPVTATDLWRLASVVQSANLFILGVSGGPREGELLSHNRDCLVETESGFRIQGRTYKLVFREDGESRDWPAPKIAVEAVAQQRRLSIVAQQSAAKFGVKNDGDPLWIVLPSSRINLAGTRLNGAEGALKKLVSVFDLDRILVGESSREKNLHPYRLRKTAARIVGLALTNSVQVLTDLFGHENPEMTLQYLLSNKDIHDEALAVAQAQTIMFAKDAIEQIDGSGGPASTVVREKIATYARLRGKTALDATDVDEIAFDLTEGGLYWELVRPGVLCTKLPGQVGVCNLKRGAADSSNCRATCGHRFELAAEKENVNRTIERILLHLQKAIDSDEPMAAANWRGQLTANLLRFEDLRIKWSAHPLVKNEDFGAVKDRFQV